MGFEARKSPRNVSKGGRGAKGTNNYYIKKGGYIVQSSRLRAGQSEQGPSNSIVLLATLFNLALVQCSIS